MYCALWNFRGFTYPPGRLWTLLVLDSARGTEGLLVYREVYRVQISVLCVEESPTLLVINLGKVSTLCLPISVHDLSTALGALLPQLPIVAGSPHMCSSLCCPPHSASAGFSGVRCSKALRPGWDRGRASLYPRQSAQ